MEKNDLFDFEFNFDEDCWSITDYDGKSEEVIFPATYKGKPVKKIGEWAFRGCTELTNIKLPEGLTSIEEWAFSGCTGLTNIKLPESLISIGDDAFHECTGLTSIKLPKGLTSIGELASGGCTGLTRVRDVFRGCTGLAEITVDENNPVFCSLDGVLFDKGMTTLMWFPTGKKGKYSVPDGIMKIGRGALHYCQEITSISFPQSLLSIESYFNGEQLTDITVSELNPEYCSVDGVLFDKKMEQLLDYPKNKDKVDYTVPDGVLMITPEAFYECKRLVNINLPESLELVDNHAFFGCEELKAITLPMNLKYIGEHAFENCKNLETITLSRKTKIGHKAFEGFAGKLVYRD
jgi:hypothetical protein